MFHFVGVHLKERVDKIHRRMEFQGSSRGVVGAVHNYPAFATI